MKTLVASLLASLIILISCAGWEEFLLEETKSVLIYITDDINKRLTERVMKEMEKDQDYHLLISSTGGTAVDAAAISNVILDKQRKGHRVTAEVHGYAMSSAVTIFLAADVRIAHKGAVFMMHQAAVASRINQRIVAKDVDGVVIPQHVKDNLVLANSFVVDMLLEKTNMSAGDVIYWLSNQDNNYMSAEKAFELGIANILE